MTLPPAGTGQGRCPTPAGPRAAPVTEDHLAQIVTVLRSPALHDVAEALPGAAVTAGSA